jgi:hydrogenase maturation protein HypF
MSFVYGEKTALEPSSQAKRRVCLHLEGRVQGVGFRPYVNRLAIELGLKGWVANSGNGVTVDIEGAHAMVGDFLQRLPAQLPPLARVDRVQSENQPLVGHTSFTIRQSMSGAEPTALVLPDMATCDDCLAEILTPTNRRYQYPFTNCTNCGPRFSILERLPYDRANTTMRLFPMCGSCQTEYDTPADRRFHAQPNACPDCGPQLVLLNPEGTKVADRHRALLAAADGLRDGQVVALKGLGGFQLLMDARNSDAVADLRHRKGRPDKPFAVMMPSLNFADAYCEISAPERCLLTSPQAPIVLLSRRQEPLNGLADISPVVAPNNPLLGAMLPYTPLHHLLMCDLGFPIIATSGNISGEPMMTGEEEALKQLHGIAGLFLVHDRPIASALDDSVVRVIADRGSVLRRARGYAPHPVALPQPAPRLLALGGHQKSAIAMTIGSQVIGGSYGGDLDSAQARKAFQRSIDHLSGLYPARPEAVTCDCHPDYYTTRAAQNCGTKVIAVQHHIAHIAACMAENNIEGPVLGVAWDGTGYGSDGTIWGGEFITVDGTATRRAGHLLPFPLPGGEKAISEPRRAAIGLLYTLCGKDVLADTDLQTIQSFSTTELKVLGQMLTRNLNTPLTSSIGRLFDAVASLTGLVQKSSFEGQAAMALEFATDKSDKQASYHFATDPLENNEDQPFIVDWRPMLRDLLADIKRDVPITHIANAFHDALINAIVEMAVHVGEARVVLTGGCFQNRYLAEGAIDRLRQAGFTPYWHQHIPTNDGGLALGQAFWATRLLRSGAA